MTRLKNPGKLFLIPTPLGSNDPAEVIPGYVLQTACGLHCFVVEELRTARRFLSAYGLRGQIDTLDLHVLNEHTVPEEVEALLSDFVSSMEPDNETMLALHKSLLKF